MKDYLKNITRKYYSFKIEYLQKSMFYGLTLDNRGNLLDQTKFLPDPWSGSIQIGKDIMQGTMVVDDFNELGCEDILKVIEKPEKFSSEVVTYVAGFFWIRHAQAFGGSNARKFVRDVIKFFIENKKNTKRFWKTQPWDMYICSSRVFNWMAAFDFFASGSDSKFQKNVLSSIMEHFSHMLKSYKSVEDVHIRINVLRTMFLCACSAKIVQKRHIRIIMKCLNKAVEEAIDSKGFYKGENPNIHFEIFSNMLEIKFMARRRNIDISKGIFLDTITRMASAVRYLRHGDGKLSNHSGSFNGGVYFFPMNRSQIIDTALSIVDTNYEQEKHFKLDCFERLANKRNIVILNTSPNIVKSIYTSKKKPGLNIFDFEFSHSTSRLINRCDIAISCSGNMIKVPSDCVITKEKTYEINKITFDGQMRYIKSKIKMAFNRTVSIYQSAEEKILTCSDIAFISQPADIYQRIMLAKNSKIEQISKNKLIVNEKFIISFDNNENQKLIINNDTMPQILVKVHTDGKSEVYLGFKIEKTQEISL